MDAIKHRLSETQKKQQAQILAVEIPLANNKGVAIADATDYEYLRKFNWYLHTTGYARATITETRKGVYMHRLLLNAKPGDQVDHISGNRLDNRRANIRMCTQSQNNANMNTPIHNTSGFKGVHWHMQRNGKGKWLAQIAVDGKNIYIGVFVDIKDAIRAYDTAARKYFGEFARTNASRLEQAS